MKRRQWARWGGLAGILWASACNGGGTGNPPGPPATLEPSGGNGQGWYFNNPLPTALKVIVLDLNGRPVPGVVVMWTVESGGGGVSPVQGTTNASGEVSTTDSLGSSTLQRVSATVTGLPSGASFTEVATTPPTSGAVSLGNNFFNPDSLVVQSDSSVTWTGNGTTHTLTFTSGPPVTPSDTVLTTGSVTRRFNAVGTYRYHCTIHAGMNGTLVVVH
jgi:plastocyanin